MTEGTSLYSSLLGFPPTFAVPLSLSLPPDSGVDQELVTTVMVGSVILSHMGLCLWWVELYGKKNQALASQPGDSPPWGRSQHWPAWREDPTPGFHQPWACVRTPGGTEVGHQDASP